MKFQHLKYKIYSLLNTVFYKTSPILEISKFNNFRINSLPEMENSFRVYRDDVITFIRHKSHPQQQQLRPFRCPATSQGQGQFLARTDQLWHGAVFVGRPGPNLANFAVPGAEPRFVQFHLHAAILRWEIFISLNTWCRNNVQWVLFVVQHFKFLTVVHSTNLQIVWKLNLEVLLLKRKFIYILNMLWIAGCCFLWIVFLITLFQRE